MYRGLESTHAQYAVSNKQAADRNLNVSRWAAVLDHGGLPFLSEKQGECLVVLVIH